MPTLAWGAAFALSRLPRRAQFRLAVKRTICAIIDLEKFSSKPQPWPIMLAPDLIRDHEDAPVASVAELTRAQRTTSEMPVGSCCRFAYRDRDGGGFNLKAAKIVSLAPIWRTKTEM